MIDLSVLLQNLQKFSPQKVSDSHHSNLLSRVSTITPNTDFQSHTLYVGYTSQVQNALGFLHGNTFFLIEDMDEFPIPDQQKNTIVLFPQEVDIHRLTEAAVETINEQPALLEDSYVLFTSFLNDGKLADLVETASRLINNPLLVIDSSFKVLAHSNMIQASDEQWNKNIERGYCSYEYIAGFNSIEGIRNAPDSDTPFCINCHTSPLRRCLSKLYYENNQLGYLIAIEVTPFDSLNMTLYKNISRLVAKLVYNENAISRTFHNEAYDSVIVDLLNGTLNSRNVFFDRLSKSGFNVHSSYRFLVVDIEQYNNYDYGSEHLRQTLRDFFKASWSLCYNNDVLALVDLEQNPDGVVQIIQANESFFRTNHLTVGISDVFSDLFEMGSYYSQAKSSLHISNKLDSDLIAIYDDYKLYDLVFTSSRKDKLKPYLNSVLKEMEQYDSDNNTEYYKTVDVYLQCNQEVKVTAKKLFVHQNTISYRITRAKELFHLDFDDYHRMFLLQYSFALAHAIQSGLFVQE